MNLRFYFSKCNSKTEPAIAGNEGLNGRELGLIIGIIIFAGIALVAILILLKRNYQVGPDYYIQDLIIMIRNYDNDMMKLNGKDIISMWRRDVLVQSLTGVM